MTRDPWDGFPKLRSNESEEEYENRKQLFQEFLDKYQIDKLAGGRTCIRRLGRGGHGRCVRYSRNHSNNPCLCSHYHYQSWMDHINLWLRDGKPIAFTSQPYNMNMPRGEVVEYCEKHNLTVDSAGMGNSFYFPDYTNLIVIHRSQPPTNNNRSAQSIAKCYNE